MIWPAAETVTSVSAGVDGQRDRSDDRRVGPAAEQPTDVGAALGGLDDGDVTDADSVALPVRIDEQQGVVGGGADHRDDGVVRVLVGRACCAAGRGA